MEGPTFHIIHGILSISNSTVKFANISIKGLSTEMANENFVNVLEFQYCKIKEKGSSSFRGQCSLYKTQTLGRSILHPGIHLPRSISLAFAV